MRPSRFLLPLACLAAACGKPPARAAGQDSVPRDTPPAVKPESLPRHWEPRPIQPPKVRIPRPPAEAPPDSAVPADSGSAGALTPPDTADSARHARAAARRSGRGGHREFSLTPADSARWPVALR